jgi:single-strand DNA-binding protein
MHSLNKAHLLGNVTKDPEIRTTSSGQSVANLSVATSQSWKDAAGQKQERTEYTPIVAWGKLAEIIQQYVFRGSKVYVEGRLQTREWEAQDGTKRQRTEIVADNVIILDKKGEKPTAMPVSEAHIGPEGGAEEIRIDDVTF